jgi:DNA-binding transcriptional ArsR family regulator
MAVPRGTATRPGGDADIAQVAALVADPGRARILLALLDGRALPASVLAAEAGVSAPATSAHLAKLVDADLITVEKSGRHRYHRLAGAHVATALEALAGLAKAQPVRSLRAHTRAAALRHARSCYDHLAGTCGVAVTAALLENGALRATDGVTDTRRRTTDRYSASLPAHPYELGADAGPVFARLGVDLDAVAAGPGRRLLLRFCLDWSEQRHHLGGRLGAALLAAFREQGWLHEGARPRTLVVTEAGRENLRDALGVDLRHASDDRAPR